jgi:hypothetical protein
MAAVEPDAHFETNMPQGNDTPRERPHLTASDVEELCRD